MSKKKEDPSFTALSERVARLEADVSWLKQIASVNVTLSAVTLITLIVMVWQIMAG